MSRSTGPNTQAPGWLPTLTIFPSGHDHRNYPEEKLQENLDSEIMEVILQEARESYDEEIVVELTSNTPDEMDSNVERIEAWVEQWKRDNGVSQ